MAFTLPKGFKLREGAEISGPLPRMAARIIEYLDKLKFEELVTTFQIAQALGYRDVDEAVMHPALRGYRFKMSPSRVVWGSRKTIAELKKQLEKM